jgi:hypothetical protein
MALLKEKQINAEDFKAQLATLQPQRRAAVAAMRADASAKVFAYFEREYLKCYSQNQIGDKFLGIAKRHRMPEVFLGAAREALSQLGWTPKRERV